MPQILHYRGEVMYRKTGRILVLQESPKHKEHANRKKKLKKRNVFSTLLILSRVWWCVSWRITELEALRQHIKYFKCPRAISHQLEQSWSWRLRKGWAYMVYFMRSRTGPADLGLLEAIMCQRSQRKGQYRNLRGGMGLKSPTQPMETEQFS